ncbi:kinase-like protein [Lichtheimia corymbifera JMRC:FSU:9682]|uniref:dual-specificity kinase n=1 Tax=Lichtheimia corymbifera JMRC:FSU:9682 TaxID=1263082 RepID=A0A068RQM9_9FUNG|nr:kinase-like protein [Lichtheimia corymbifera JMRC:FSU:9682]
MLGDGRYTKSTASSRSRARPTGADETQLNTRKSIKELRQSIQNDAGMSRDGIFEAFAQVDNDDTIPSTTTTAAPVKSSITPIQRRKSTNTNATNTSSIPANSVNLRIRRRSTKAATTDDPSSLSSSPRIRAMATTTTGISNNPESPRVRALQTKKSTESINSSRRRTSTAAASSPRAQPIATSGGSGGGGTNTRLVSSSARKLGHGTEEADANKTTARRSTATSDTDVKACGSSSDAFRLADHLRDSLVVERRLARQEFGLHSEKGGSHAHGMDARKPTLDAAITTRRASTTKAAASNNRAEVITDVKRRLSLGKERIRDVEKNGVGSPKSTRAEPRRRTLSSGSILRTALKDEHGRRKSTTSAAAAATRGDDNTREESLVMLATKRRSVIANSRTSSAASRRQETPAEDNKPRRRMSRGTPATSEATNSTRTRKKSIVAMDDSNLGVRRARRMSRTESLKEGVPTDPSLNAALAWRTKTQADQESFIARRQATKKIIASSNGSTTTTGRRRGKTLPGNLASPPPIHTLNLPPMKMEPIHVNMPKLTTGTTPIATARASASRSSQRSTTTPNDNSGEEDTTANNKDNATSTATRKSHLGISSERRSSIKTPRIAPASPREAATATNNNAGISSATASPRARPLNTRRPSATNTRKLSLTSNKSYGDDVSPSLGPARTRKISTNSIGGTVVPSTTRATSLYGASGPSSRKSSVTSSTMEYESVVDKEVGIQRHRAMSLQERLQAMVRQHTENTAIKDSYASDMQYSMIRTERRPSALRASQQQYDMEDDTATATTPSSPGSDPYAWDLSSSGLRAPKSPTTAIKCYSKYLSLYERMEIQQYGEVYFVGHHAHKNPATPDHPEQNYGYDDERGDYNIVLQDHLAYRYEVIDVLGRGSFGQVVKCFDHKTGDTMAIKLIRNKKRFHAQAQTEIKILQNLVDWDPEDQHHNVRMTDYFVFRNHLCIACECLSINLYEFIKANNYKGFNLSLIKRFTVQILQSLCLLYEHGVIHCDLKPENILLKHPSRSTIKVIDFGSSCLETDRVYTYIQSRFYRSPEVILGLPIFPGENEHEQLACIMEILGVPSRYLIEQSSRRKLFFDSSGNPRIIPNSRGKKRRPGTKTLAQVLRCTDPRFLDFVERCLQWDPERRMTPDQALCHDWILHSSRHSNGHKYTTPVAVCNTPGASGSTMHDEEATNNHHHLAAVEQF